MTLGGDGAARRLKSVIKKYDLLDFSWWNERKCLFLQTKVDYIILLWI